MKYILASKSPRRQELLKKIVSNFKIVESHADESYNSQTNILKIPEKIALKKALAVQQNYPNDCIIAADTIVVINQKILGKPLNDSHAFQMLSELSNQTHKVITGVCILKGKQKILFHSVTKVTFYDLTKKQIEDYIHTKSPFDKAGGYGIQDEGALFIKKINGDYYNVMGLPISLLSRVLKKM